MQSNSSTASNYIFTQEEYLKLKKNIELAVEQKTKANVTHNFIKSVHTLMHEDFDKSLKNIPAWLRLTDQQHIIDYLGKLKTQISIAQTVLKIIFEANFLSPEQVEQSQKLIWLWKEVRRKEVQNYFQKSADNIQSTASDTSSSSSCASIMNILHGVSSSSSSSSSSILSSSVSSLDTQFSSISLVSSIPGMPDRIKLSENKLFSPPMPTLNSSHADISSATGNLGNPVRRYTK